MINKKGESYLEGNLVYIILFVIFFIIALTFLYRYESGVLFQEQYYSYSIAKIVNDAKVGDKIEVNVDKAIVFAKRGEVEDISKIIRFDNDKKEVIVELQKGSETRYPFLRNYDIESYGVSDGIDGQTLIFSVREAVR